MVAIILQYRNVSTQQVVHLILTQCYVNYVLIKLEKIDKGKAIQLEQDFFSGFCPRCITLHLLISVHYI